MGETLIAHPDERAEALEYDKNAIGIYIWFRGIGWSCVNRAN